MAAARLSPAAGLLRNSRLFALPPPLPPPDAEVYSKPEGRSDTASLPYPTRAAIETPLLSLNKGDWGLKRPLPLKSTTKSGTPIMRIQGGIDTREHIADFESAADHALTLRKWQDMHMPMSAPQVDTSGRDTPSENVFSATYDNISNTQSMTASRRRITGVWPNVPASLLKDASPAPETTSRASLAPNPKRWRYNGPWLAGMSGMEFEAYLKDQVRRRKGEFKEMVRAHMIAQRTSERKKEAMEKGEGVGSTTGLVEITESELAEYMRSLRTTPYVFGPLITEFLDLPEGPDTPRISTELTSQQWRNGRSTLAARVYRDVGPPKTHPSAGLSYLKVGPKTYARNDPVYGPQFLNPPVQARVLKTRRKSNTVDGALGVAGVVANNVEISGINSKQLFEAYDPKPGGHKRVVRPVSASLNSNGTVNLNVKVAASHRLEEDESLVLEQGQPRPEGSVRRNADYAAGMPRLDGGFRSRGTGQSRAQPSSATKQGIDDLKRAFDPFGNRMRRG